MDYFEILIARYRNKGLLIDTNLLLLYFVGTNDPNRIQKFKRTMIFNMEEFLLLVRFLTLFCKVVTIPNVLTEVSNLLGQLPQDLHASAYNNFGIHLAELEEHYIPSVGISTSGHFLRFGLTDSGIIELVKDGYLVLTDDLKLAGYLQNHNIDVVNFNHLRALAWN